LLFAFIYRLNKEHPISKPFNGLGAMEIYSMLGRTKKSPKNTGYDINKKKSVETPMSWKIKVARQRALFSRQVEKAKRGRRYSIGQDGY
jgi:hypothetical protein